MQGLLNNKKLLIITSRGAMFYDKNGNLESFDFQENYLKSVFLIYGDFRDLFCKYRSSRFWDIRNEKD